MLSVAVFFGRWLPVCSAHPWGRAIVGTSTMLYRKWQVCSRKGFQSLGIFFPISKYLQCISFLVSVVACLLETGGENWHVKSVILNLLFFTTFSIPPLLYSLHIN